MTAQLILIRMPIDCLKTDNHEEQRNLVQKIYLKLLLPQSHGGTPLTISCPCSLTKNIWNECWPLSQQKYEMMEIQISIFNSFLKQQTVFFFWNLVPYTKSQIMWALEENVGQLKLDDQNNDWLNCGNWNRQNQIFWLPRGSCPLHYLHSQKGFDKDLTYFQSYLGRRPHSSKDWAHSIMAGKFRIDERPVLVRWDEIKSKIVRSPKTEIERE
jgi:hypothetical protein